MKGRVYHSKNYIIRKGIAMETNIVYCAKCDTPIVEGLTYADRHYCESCYNELFIECAECAEIIERTEAIKHDGSYYCDDCFNEEFETCSECGETFHRDNAVYDDNSDRIYCEDCYNKNFSQCDACNNMFHNDDIHCYDNNIYCDECFSELFDYCSSCGETIPRDYAMYDEHSGEVYCESCYAENCTVIRSHNFTPELKFYGRKDKDLFFGLEYEVYNKEGNNDNIDVAAKIQEEFNALYIKSDSSINDGFEIVTMPCSLQYHKEHMHYTGIVELLKEQGFLSDSKTGNCGIHVHVGRREIEEKLGITTSSKIGLFVKTCKQYCDVMARRSDSQWCSHDNIDKDEYKNMAKDETPTKEEKYDAVNYMHDETIEVRIFAGSIRAYRILAAIELVHAITYFVSTIGFNYLYRNYDYTIWEKFKLYIKGNPKLYKELLKDMNEHNI